MSIAVGIISQRSGEQSTFRGVSASADLQHVVRCSWTFDLISDTAKTSIVAIAVASCCDFRAFPRFDKLFDLRAVADKSCWTGSRYRRGAQAPVLVNEIDCVNTVVGSCAEINAFGAVLQIYPLKRCVQLKLPLLQSLRREKIFTKSHQRVPGNKCMPKLKEWRRELTMSSMWIADGKSHAVSLKPEKSTFVILTPPSSL